MEVDPQTDQTVSSTASSSMELIQGFYKMNDLQQKLQVIKLGRPTPPLPDLFQRKGQKIIRRFQSDWYARKDWLCGNAANSKLYCFPCVLFSRMRDHVWVRAGYSDLSNLVSGLTRHERSIAHIQNQIALKTFGKCFSGKQSASDHASWQQVSLHNAKVRENREILTDLIRAICYLAKQELVFRGSDESIAISSNRGNYLELLNVFAEKDQRLEKLLEVSSVFTETSSRIPNNLILAISDTLRQDIQAEIDAAPYVSVKVDEMEEAQASVTLRYVSSGEVKEAFLGFTDMSKFRTSAAASEHVLAILDSFNCTAKLIAQTCDGAAVLESKLKGVQLGIKERAPNALSVHCYAHDLNFVLVQSAKSIKDCRDFFHTVEGLASFFRRSVKLTNFLHETVKLRLPKVKAARFRWYTLSRLVQVISLHYEDFCKMFHLVCEREAEWDSNTRMLAAGYKSWMSKTSTCFLVLVYDQIFNATDRLTPVLQTKSMDANVCCRSLSDSLTTVCTLKNNFNLFHERTEVKGQLLGLTGDDEETKETRKLLFLTIVENIQIQMKTRFDHYEKLSFIGLVDPCKFVDLDKSFDEGSLKALSKTYSKYFDFIRLKADLTGLYRSQMIRETCKSPTQLLTFLHSHDLMATVQEAAKLLCLVLTLPSTEAFLKRSSWALKRIQAYSQTAMGGDKECVSALALVSAESERLTGLRKSQEKFYNDVIERFVARDKRMDFIFK